MLMHAEKYIGYASRVPTREKVGITRTRWERGTRMSY